MFLFPGPLAGVAPRNQDVLELRFDLNSPTYPISPLIYGMNNLGGVDTQFAKEIRLPVSRWGGDATSRYNWTNDGSNAGDDWFFMAGKNEEHPVSGASSDAFIARAKAAGGIALLTLPIIDYVNRVVGTDSSYPVSLFGPQQKVNPYAHPVVDGKPTDAGNGRKPDGSPIVLSEDQILRTNLPNSRAFEKTWIDHLIAKFGKAATGGVAIYQMDNEPSGWANTHRDIHPVPPTYKEIVEKTVWYSNQVKQSDPSAAVLGPGDFGWPVYKGDPGKQGGLWNAEYYLQQMQVASSQAGTRLLDYFDEHYYPVAADGKPPIALAPAGDASNQAARLESTRSLWDPSFVEQNWIGKYDGAIRLIPRMREWVAKFYPGTKTAITEYNFGGMESLNGALAEADVLGIFAREKLDLATLWDPPKPSLPGAFAFRVFRDYDGKGSSFGDEYLPSSLTTTESTAAYVSLRKSDRALVIVLINKSVVAKQLKITVTGRDLKTYRSGQAYLYDAGDLAHIRNIGQLTADHLNVSLPPSSLNVFVLNR